MNNTRSAQFFMANLGSEVSRLLSALEKGDKTLAVNCQKRAQDIVTKLRGFPEMKAREKEISILEAVINNFFEKDKKFTIENQTLRDYLLPFATHAMK